MANIPFRREIKIGRNDPCFCGSGRKYTHCHGEVRDTVGDKVQELQRQKQQGLGRRIISKEHNGKRHIAVGNQWYRGDWKTFHSFLDYYIKQVLGVDWGNAEMAKAVAERHPLLQWYEQVFHLHSIHAKAIEVGDLFYMPSTGAVSAYVRLAYNLYLIAHNGKDIQTRLIARLKSEGEFQGAFFETQVAAWLIRAGFELEFEDESDRTSTHCEFTATHIATGEKYSVEAKSRKLESSKASRAKVGRKLHDALEKRANHKRLIFLDLNKPLRTQNAGDSAAERARRIIRQQEKFMIDGIPAPAAYIYITNMNDQYMLDAAPTATMFAFCGYKIRDFVDAAFPSLREAARARERHWPMFQLFESMKTHCEIPQTFGGELPSEVFVRNAPPRLQVGQVYAVSGPDGAEVNAELKQATIVNDNAHCIFHDPKTNISWVGTFNMTPDEVADYSRYRDTYFGDLQRQTRRPETPLELFDILVNDFRETPKERLFELISNCADQQSLPAMSQRDLVELVADHFGMLMIAKGFFRSARAPRSGASPG
jgi:hypothetical protein